MSYSQEQKQQASARISAARINLIENYVPYYETGIVAIMTRAIEDDRKNVFSITKGWTLNYSIDVALNHSIEQLSALWLHCFEHVIRNHGQRYANSVMEPSEETQWVWETVTDYFINQEIHSLKLPIPELINVNSNPLIMALAQQNKLDGTQSVEEVFYNAIKHYRNKPETTMTDVNTGIPTPEQKDNNESDNPETSGSGENKEDEQNPQDQKGTSQDNNESDNRNQDKTDAKKDSSSKNDDKENSESQQSNSNIDQQDRDKAEQDASQNNASDDNSSQPQPVDDSNIQQIVDKEKITQENSETSEQQSYQSSSSQSDDGQEGGSETPDQDSQKDQNNQSGQDSSNNTEAENTGEVSRSSETQTGDGVESSDPSINNQMVKDDTEPIEKTREKIRQDMPDEDHSCGSGASEISADEEELPFNELDEPSIHDILERMINDSSENKSLHAGTIPGDKKIEIESGMTPQISWEPLLSRSIRRKLGSKFGKFDYSFSKRSRMHQHTNVIYPALVGPSTANIFVIVDTSASMKKPEIVRGLTELERLSKRIQGKIYVTSVDSAAHDIQEIRSVRNLELKGGGGTDLRKGLKKIKEYRKPADVIIFITDGGTPWHQEKPFEFGRTAFIAVIIVSNKSGLRVVKRVPDYMETIIVPAYENRSMRLSI